MRLLRNAIIVILLVGFSLPVLSNAPWEAPSPEDVQAALEGLAFDEFIEVSFRLYLLRRPEAATSWGLSSQFGIRNDVLDNYSPDYLLESQAIAVIVLDKLRLFDLDVLDVQQRTTYGIALRYWTTRADDGADIVAYPLTLQTLTSLDCRLERTLTQNHPFSTQDDIRDYLSRLMQAEQQLDQLIELLAFYRDRGVVAPHAVLEEVQHRIAPMISTNTLLHPFYSTLRTKGGEITDLSSETFEAYLEEARSTIDEVIKPAYRRLYFAVIDVLEDAPLDLSIGQYPNGDESYEFLARLYTDSDLTLDQIYERASQELAWLRKEMLLTAEAANIKSVTSLAEIIERAARPAGVAVGEHAIAEAQALLTLAQDLVIEAEVFWQLPVIDVEIQGDRQGGRYSSGALDGSKPAVYYVNGLYGTPRYLLPSITYHETVPGHHVQKAIAQALDVPLLRRVVGYSAHSEGWAEYAERLMDELGAYDGNPRARLGWLDGQIVKTVAMMTDIALHHLGWQQDELERFIMESTGYTREEACDLIVYTAASPASMLSYSAGQLEILALREQAKEALGDQFDIRTFHDLILGNGNVPLSYVRQLVEEWIDS